MSIEDPEDLEPATLVSGWQRYVFPGLWLIYLVRTVDGVHQHSTGLAAIAGYTIVAAFCLVYILSLPAGWSGRHRTFWMLYATGIVLIVAETFFAQESALAFCIYLAVLTMAANRRWSFAVLMALAVATAVLPAVVPGWGGRIDWTDGFTLVMVGIAMFGFFLIVRANRALSAARAEVARLAAENERSRIARDLHDLLGHSLTTITVKAGLARRLSERDDPRAATEISEVEALARRTLGDVRAAVTGHREVTLATELATTRELLRAAAINADLPPSVDLVDPALSECFGWVLREGITNVVRHSRAASCRVTVGTHWIEIADSGSGPDEAVPGNGLNGLRERLAGFGGTVSTARTFTGFRLRAEVPPPNAELLGESSDRPSGESSDLPAGQPRTIGQRA